MRKTISFILCIILCIAFINPQTAEAAIVISKAKATMEVDSTLKLKVTGTYSKITWKSSKKSVATVNSSGVVTAKMEGKATITATVDKKKYTCNVTVVDSNKTKPYKTGDTWTVDGIWTLTFNSVTTTEERYHQPGDDIPKQVVVLDYTYEGIDDGGNYMDMYTFSVIDANGNIARKYPSKDMDDTKLGEKCEGLKAIYGLFAESDMITVKVTMYDDDYSEYKAIFELDIE